MSDPTQAARQWREERFRARMDNYTKSAGPGTMGGSAIIAPLPPGREGGLGDPVPSLPPPENELVAVVADQQVSPSGELLTWRAVTKPPSRQGFEYLDLPSTDVPLTLPAAYTVHVEVDWHQGQGGAVEIWVAGQRHHVSQTGRTGNITAEVTVSERLAPLQVRTRHAGDPVRVSAKMTVQLGRDLPEHDPTDDPEEDEQLDTLDTPDAPAAIPGTELNSAYVDLAWNPVAGAEWYEAVVQHVELGNFITVEVEDTEARVDGLDPLTDYVARIVAHAEGAFPSHPSDDTPFSTPADETIPEAPVGVRATAGFTTVTGMWEENREHDVARGAGHYEVELSEVDDPYQDVYQDAYGSASHVVAVETTTSVLIAFRDLEEGTVFAVRVRAVDSSGNVSEWSARALARTAIVNLPPMRDFEEDPILKTEIGDEQIETPHLAANAVETRHLRANVVDAEKANFIDLLASSATVRKITADDAVFAEAAIVDADIANLSADKLQANSGDFSFLESEVVLVGKAIHLGSGGMLRALGSGDGRVDFSSFGISATNSSGSLLFALTPSGFSFNGAGTFSGALEAASGTFAGDVTAGATITGALFRTGTSGERVVIDSGDDSIQIFRQDGVLAARIGIGEPGEFAIQGMQFSFEAEMGLNLDGGTGGVNTWSDAYVDGDLDVAGSKNAKITDPDDPTRSYRFAAVEADEAGLLMKRLTVEVGPGNRKTVPLPEHWARLTRDADAMVNPVTDKAGPAAHATVDLDAPSVTVYGRPGTYRVWVMACRNDPAVAGWTHTIDMERADA